MLHCLCSNPDVYVSISKRSALLNHTNQEAAQAYYDHALRKALNGRIKDGVRDVAMFRFGEQISGGRTMLPLTLSPLSQNYDIFSSLNRKFTTPRIANQP